MSLIFLSHSSQDNEHTEKLATWLREKEQRSIFLDFDPATGIPAGHEWEKELYQQLRQCQAVIVLCSEHSMDSEWCFAEAMFAKALGKHIFPIRLDQSTIWPILTSLQIIDFTSDTRERFERLWRAMMLKGLDPKSIFDWDGSRPPYPGLPSFEEKDAAIFFGREEEIHEVIAELNLSRQLADNRMMILEGISGSGKSSLLRAGVIPRLKNDIDNWIVVDPFRPLRNPVHELSLVLRKALSRYDTDESLRIDLEQIINSFEEHKHTKGLLNRAIRILRDATKNRDAMVVLIIDQLEELLGPEQNKEMEYLMQLLASSLQAEDCEYLLIATMRADFRSEFEIHPVLGNIQFKTYSVMPMKIESFEKVIRGPAELDGLQLESGLVHTIISDIESRNALPLLAFTLRELWDRYGGDKQLTIEEYQEKLGGLHNSVAKVAESALQAKTPSKVLLKAIRDALISLARINEEGQFVRQPQLWDDLPVLSHPIMEEFINKHLLVSRVEEKTSECLVEVAHEALFRTWTRLKEWLDEEKGFLEWRYRLQTEIVDWQHVDQDKGSLLRGAALNEALSWFEKKRDQLKEKERVFIQKSRNRRARLRKLFTSFGISTGLIILASAVVAFVQRDHAIEARNDARARLIANYWMNAIDERDDRNNTLKASHYFMQAAEISRERNEQDFKNASLAGELLNGELRLDAITDDDSAKPDWFVLTEPCPGDAAPVKTSYEEGAIYLPDGLATIKHELVRCAVYSDSRKKILSWGDDHFVRVWTDKGESLLNIKHKDNVRGAKFNKDQSIILSWSDDRTAILWDGFNGQRLSLEMLHDGPVRGASFSLDETTIVTRDDEEIIRVWKRQETRPLTRFYPDEETVNTSRSDRLKPGCSTQDGTAYIRDPDKWKQARAFKHARPVMGCDYNSEYGKLLTWTSKFDLQLWNVESGNVLFEMPVNKYFNGAVIAATGDRILSWYSDGAAQIWDLPNNQLLAELSHPNQIKGAILNQTEDKILVWDLVGNLKLSDIVSTHELFPPLKHRNVENAIFSPGGQYIASWSLQRLKVWDAVKGHLITPLLRHKGHILDVKFNSNETQITVRMDNGVRLWNLPARNSQSNQNPVLAQEVLTGTRLNLETGELQVLNKEDWASRKQQLSTAK